MATIYTTEAQSQSDAASNHASAVRDGSKIGGQVYSAVVTRVIGTGSTDATGDVLRLVQLPDGARVLPESIRVWADNPGTAYNIAKIGDLADDDRYTATNINASAGGYFAATPAVTGPVNDYRVGDDAADTGWITATLGTVTTPTADADVTITFSYALKN